MFHNTNKLKRIENKDKGSRKHNNKRLRKDSDFLECFRMKQ